VLIVIDNKIAEGDRKMKKVTIVTIILSLVMSLFVLDINNVFAANFKFWLKMAEKYPNKAHIYLRRAESEIKEAMDKFPANEIVSWDNDKQRIVSEGRIGSTRKSNGQVRIIRPDGTGYWTPARPTSHQTRGTRGTSHYMGSFIKNLISWNKERQEPMNKEEKNQAFNKLSELWKQLFKFKREGNIEEARKIWDEILPIFMRIGRSSIRRSGWWKGWRNNRHNRFGNKTPASDGVSSSVYYSSPQSIIGYASDSDEDSKFHGTNAYFRSSTTNIGN